jgi:hypothetical protein
LAEKLFAEAVPRRRGSSKTALAEARGDEQEEVCMPNPFGEGGRERSPVGVAPEVLDGLDTVSESGLVKMVERSRVVSLCFELGYPETAFWVEENPAEYSQGIVHGFEEWRS